MDTGTRDIEIVKFLSKVDEISKNSFGKSKDVLSKQRDNWSYCKLESN